MSRKTLARGFRDEGRLRVLLSLFFLALAIPTGALIWQAYSQLRWEAFHQYRGMAEELTGRINSELVTAIARSEARSFADYSFLVLSGEPSANFLQQSVLSAFPVVADIPGLLGYFQVGTQGEFRTPLLPAGNQLPEFYGISKTELRQRQALAAELKAVLSNNRLVDSRAATATIATSAAADIATVAKMKPAARQAPSSQRAFDQLKDVRSPALYDAGEAVARDEDLAVAEEQESREQDRSLGRVADIKLDSSYQEKSSALEQAQQQRAGLTEPAGSRERLSRKERISVAESIAQHPGPPADGGAGRKDVRIVTFESEIDPLEFSLLDSGHLVLFRKVWRDGQRFIQGMLLAQDGFIEGAVQRAFQGTALSAMSFLVVGYQGEVLSTLSGGRDNSYTRRPGELDGALLYRSQLAAPFDSLELIYSVTQLPPGPGARVLAWVSLVLVLVLCGGCYGLYRLGLGQLRLARQQQDFVSAVSHELKTPLTSIRMYGEMLKEGWAPEPKKQAYYEYIFDESERLTRLIANVLQLANINHNTLQLEMKPVAVGDLMAGIEQKIATQVQRAGFELVILRDPVSDLATVNVDRDRVTQVIINLVDNAIKFSSGAAQKRIELGARLGSDNRVLLSLRDFGPGIAKDQMRKIFDMFYRSESELTRETVGTGIGLAIVHQLCSAMDASVDVLNRDPGAEFRVSIAVCGNQDVRD